MNLEWMAWTPFAAGLFAVIFLILCGMTVWEVVSPCVARRGLLPLTTTRGDRLFIGLLASAYLHLAWMGLTDLNLWFATALSACLLIVIIRWG